MSKLVVFTFLLFSTLVSFSSTVKAASCNLVETKPSPIYSNSDNATFTINVGNNNEPGITSWKMEFQCGARYQQPDASKNPDSQTISTIIQRSRKPQEGCEFSTPSHTIQVKAINTNGDWLNWCPVVSYNVIDSDSFCRLSINPSTGLTPTSVIQVSGENLTKDGQFQLLIDNDKIGPAYYVDTPTFSGITIPLSYLSLDKPHKLYLERLQVGFGGSSYGPPLCPLEFTVGTTSSPGSVTGGTKGGSSGTTSPPTLAGGQELKGCTDDEKNPGIATAIGCIHTNPAAFVQDFLRFVVGAAGGLAFLMMLLGAFQLLTSQGNPDSLNAGRERLSSAVIGLLFIIFAVLLLQIIGVDILRIPGFGK